jgi:hypothetical protein
MKQYFYSYQCYVDGVKGSCGHHVTELNDNPATAIKDAIKYIRDRNDDQSIDVHLLAFNKI